MKDSIFTAFQGVGGIVATNLIAPPQMPVSVQITNIIAQTLITIFTGYFTYLTYKQAKENKEKK